MPVAAIEITHSITPVPFISACSQTFTDSIKIEIKSVEGGNRLLEYESKVTMLLREHPITAVCQYNSNSFDGATIMDVLKVHPMMIVSGSVISNPFFIEPEEFLKA